MFNKFNQVMFDADKGTTGGQGQGEVGNKTDNASAEDNGTENKDTETDKPLSLEDVQKMIQSETDKVRGEYSKKLKEKEDALETLRKETMTEEERAQEDAQKLMKTLEERERELERKELTLKTIDLLKENDLPLDVKDFLIGNDEESTLENVQSFKKMFDSALEVAVTEKFKKSGKEHANSSGHIGRYTQEDLNKMSAEEINKNWDKIQKDLS